MGNPHVARGVLLAAAVALATAGFADAFAVDGKDGWTGLPTPTQPGSDCYNKEVTLTGSAARLQRLQASDGRPDLGPSWREAARSPSVFVRSNQPRPRALFIYYDIL